MLARERGARERGGGAAEQAESRDSAVRTWPPRAGSALSDGVNSALQVRTWLLSEPPESSFSLTMLISVGHWRSRPREPRGARLGQQGRATRQHHNCTVFMAGQRHATVLTKKRLQQSFHSPALGAQALPRHVRARAARGARGAARLSYTRACLLRGNFTGGSKEGSKGGSKEGF